MKNGYKMLSFLSFLSFFSLLIILNAQPAVALRPKGTPPQGGWKPDAGLTLGASGAYLHGGALKHAFSPAVELSYFRKLASPFTFWGSVGGKLVTASDTAFLPFVETGINLLVLNLGGGYAVGFPDVIGHQHINLFAGLSVPVFTPKRGRLLYAQLYYRPIFTLPASDFPVSHELGLMLKWLMVLP